jgi:hypothetical protein
LLTAGDVVNGTTTMQFSLQRLTPTDCSTLTDADMGIGGSFASFEGLPDESCARVMPALVAMYNQAATDVATVASACNTWTAQGVAASVASDPAFGWSWNTPASSLLRDVCQATCCTAGAPSPNVPYPPMAGAQYRGAIDMHGAGILLSPYNASTAALVSVSTSSVTHIELPRALPAGATGMSPRLTDGPHSLCVQSTASD